ncbi:hypothetical protein KC19_8G171100 [Ceratodon purpureus]|uniref:Uncharacterized protein n=1 Tax=Ceratodon purpureus TaxID=3225 RepID=A0A8T0H469_CERPU|nr:hypothetical protein KC19_8G171100 [Ceratodon purpureus]
MARGGSDLGDRWKGGGGGNGGGGILLGVWGSGIGRRARGLTDQGTGRRTACLNVPGAASSTSWGCGEEGRKVEEESTRIYLPIAVYRVVTLCGGEALRAELQGNRSPQHPSHHL